MTRRPRRRAARAVRGASAGIGRLAQRIWLLVFAALVLALAYWLFWPAGPAAGGGARRHVVLDRGDGVVEIAQKLRRAGAIRSSGAFWVAAEATGAARELKAGEYAFSARASLWDVLNAIRRGLVVRRFVTIPEGLTSKAAMDILNRTGDLTGVASTPPEGAILPETYEVRRGESRAAVVRRMTAARDDLLARLWRGRAAGLPYRSREEAVVLASIVEKETAKAGERPKIAAVFLNRLAAGIRLESDPTVVYGLTGGAPLGHGLRVSELASRTPYNTYMVAGLPPTPIANPGRAALAAALDPAKTHDLYFVADGTGGHVFSDNFQTHLRNVARWRAVERAGAGAGAP